MNLNHFSLCLMEPSTYIFRHFTGISFICELKQHKIYSNKLCRTMINCRFLLRSCWNRWKIGRSKLLITLIPHKTMLCCTNRPNAHMHSWAWIKTFVPDVCPQNFIKNILLAIVNDSRSRFIAYYIPFLGTA